MMEKIKLMQFYLILRRKIVTRALFFTLFYNIASISPTFASLTDTIKIIKPSIVGVGVYNPLGSPRAQLRGTGFIIGDNGLVVTNHHVLEKFLDDKERMVIFYGTGRKPEILPVEVVAKDEEHDLAILRIEQVKKVTDLNMKGLKITGDSKLEEGARVAFTGFPIGAVLGLYPVTHEGIISAVTPVAIPASNARQLNLATLKRLKKPYFVYQLDATAYPGNSGSPVYNPDTGEVVGIINKVFVKQSKEAVLSNPSGITYAIPSEYLKTLLMTLNVK